MLKTPELGEIGRCKQVGVYCLEFKSFKECIESLGYSIDKSMIAYGLSTDCTTGERYRGVTFGVRESDTGLSAFSVDARRDANFELLQDFRSSCISVYNNCVASV